MGDSRRGRAEDLDAVWDIQNSVADIPRWSRAQWEGELDSARGLFLVAEDQGSIVGYAVARIVAPEAELEMIVVDPERGRRGWGTRLLESVIAAVRLRDCTLLRLEVSQRNEAARAFYAARGFHVVGHRGKYYNDGADALLMDKPLL